MDDEIKELSLDIKRIKIAPPDFPEVFKEIKKGWGEGPWQTEPDFFEFKYKGIDCVLKRSISGTWCGYVIIPQSSPYVDRDDFDELEMHGGITFTQKEENGDVTIGFDCAHSEDFIPSFIPIYQRDSFRNIFDEPIYRDINYAMHECENIVDQITKGV